MGRTNLRNIRVPQTRWDAALAKAHEEGTSLAAVINAWLIEYTGEEPDDEHEPESG